jgi:YidC/Oxa1 family membrane protein insertase
MDKRSILAIAVTFLVLLLWQAVFIAPKQREFQRKQAVELREKKRADSLAAVARGTARAETLATVASPSPAGHAAPIAAAGEGAFFFAGADTVGGAIVTIVTDDVKAVLSSRGGELRRIELLHFLEKNKRPVEIIPAGKVGGFGMSFLRDGAWQGLSPLAFDAAVDGSAVKDSAVIRLGPGKDSVAVVFNRKGSSGESIEKSYTFHRSGYAIGLAVAIDREGSLAKSSAYALGWTCGMAQTEPDKRSDFAKFASLGGVGAEFYKVPLMKFSKEPARSFDGSVVWAGARTKYFLSAIITRPGARNTGTLTLRGDRAADYVGYSIGYPFRGDPRHVADSFTAYVGPLDMQILKSYHSGVEQAIDLGKLRFFSIFILKFMMWMKRYIPNYGVIIIILSVMTKLLFYRLTHKSFRSMKDMQRIQPRMKELQEKYKDNRTKLNEEMMKLYKEAGVNPLGGCLPLVLQMPVFWALFNVLSNTIELRNAPFAGWISDLSSPDVLFSFGVTIPFLGSNFHLLPILMGVAMVIQTKLGGSPTGDGTPAAAQTKMMNFLMPILFTVIFYAMPSGLVLYWFVNNALSIIQQYYVQKQVEAEDALKLTGAQVPGSTAVGTPVSEGSSGRAGNDPSSPGKKSKRRTGN